MALTTRQRLREYFNSWRKEVRPLVVKQTERKQKERKLPGMGSHPKSFNFSFYAIVLFNLVAHQIPGWSCQILLVPLVMARKSQHTEVNQVAKAPHSDSTTQKHTTFGHRCRRFKVIWRERPPWNWILLLRWEGGASYFYYLKNPNNQSIINQSMPKNIDISQLHGPFRKFTA